MAVAMEWAGSNAGALIEAPQRQLIVQPDAQGRTSDLLAPNMLLTGHDGPVYSICFDPQGQHLASASFDRDIFLWDVYGECKNYNVLSGHKNAVLEVHWTTDGLYVVSCSADKTVGVWDVSKGRRVSKLAEHQAIVNTCCISKENPELFASGSDDCSMILWDARMRKAAHSFYADFQVTAVCMSNDGLEIFSGGIDNVVRRFDVRHDAETLTLNGPEDTISGLSTHPNGTHVLSNSMDGTLRSWDVRPYVENEETRCERVFQGGTHGAEKLLLKCAWSPDGNRVTCGSSDRIVKVWDYATAQLLYYLPGHSGSVNEVIFHPREHVIASCGSDKQIFIGELSA